VAFTDEQVRQLKAKLDAKHVKTRSVQGTELHYVEGWHAIAEANRIFGFDAWDRRTLSSTCIHSGMSAGHHCASYTAKVRVSVRAGDAMIVREGSGTGEGKAPTPGQAHDLALKGAETDATKRALATFGNPFGLALYDREQASVRKPRNGKSAISEHLIAGPWMLRSATGTPEASFDKPDSFADALREAMGDAQDIELLFAIWEQNVDTVRSLNKSLKQGSASKAGIAKSLVAHLKTCAIALAKAGDRAGDGTQGIKDEPSLLGRDRPKIDKSVLTISEPQPCLICGRLPSHAHHVRYAQSRGLGLKVSDEFTVPLCATHHAENHATGDELRWWQDHKTDPLAVADRLWRQTHPVKHSIPLTAPSMSQTNAAPHATPETKSPPTPMTST
jgi:hypothetical protein